MATIVKTGTNQLGAYWAHLDQMLELDQFNAVMRWCIDTYGSEGIIGWPNDLWMEYENKFWFRDEQDRTMFVLKWS